MSVFQEWGLELSCLCFVEYIYTRNKRERLEFVAFGLAYAEKLPLYL
jgi:hypothetical protein